MQAVLYMVVVVVRNLKKGFLSSHKIRCHVLRITAMVKQRQLSWDSHWGHMHEDYSAAIYVKPTMLTRTSIDRPLFYEFIFNLSFDPRLVCSSGFILSPLGSEVMISCHVAFFRVICYNPVLQIKMTTTEPSGTCMKTS